MQCRTETRVKFAKCPAMVSNPAFLRQKISGLMVRGMLYAGLLTLSGCLVGPDYRKPAMLMPGQWSTSAPAASSQPAQLAGWWRRLDDPLLNKLVHEAIIGNTDVATAKARVREARASLQEATASFLPTLSGTASETRNHNKSAHNGSSYGGGLDSSWEIDLFGANRRAAEAAQYGLDAAEENLRATMVTLIGDVASNYVEARGLQMQIALDRKSAAAQRNTADLTRKKFAAGDVSALDVNNAEGLAYGTEANIPKKQAQLAETLHRLSILTGNAPLAVTRLMQPGGKLPVPRWPIPAGIPADILLTRPDVREAERRYAASTAKIGQREAERYPALKLTGHINTNAASIGALGRSSSIGWSFGPDLTIPLFEGGKRVASVSVARAQRDQSFIAYRAAILKALEEVENALVSLSNYRMSAGKQSKSAKAYGRALELSRSLYESGNTGFLDVLSAERSHYSAEQTAILNRVAITKYYIALMKALGGGWDGLVDVSKPEIMDTNTGPHVRKGR